MEGKNDFLYGNSNPPKIKEKKSKKKLHAIKCKHWIYIEIKRGENWKKKEFSDGRKPSYEIMKQFAFS